MTLLVRVVMGTEIASEGIEVGMRLEDWEGDCWGEGAVEEGEEGVNWAF